MDYFELLGLKKQFGLDLETLEKNYLELQQRFHPDRFGNCANQERLISVQKAADINAAYETLKSPLKRAEYLLITSGYAMNDRALGEGIDPEILEQSICFREELEASNDLDSVSSLEEEALENKKNYISAIETFFDNNNLEEAKKLFLRLKYTEKFLSEARIKRLKLENHTDAA